MMLTIPLRAPVRRAMPYVFARQSRRWAMRSSSRDNPCKRSRRVPSTFLIGPGSVGSREIPSLPRKSTQSTQYPHTLHFKSSASVFDGPGIGGQKEAAAERPPGESEGRDGRPKRSIRSADPAPGSCRCPPGGEWATTRASTLFPCYVASRPVLAAFTPRAGSCLPRPRQSVSASGRSLLRCTRFRQ